MGKLLFKNLNRETMEGQLLAAAVGLLMATQGPCHKKSKDYIVEYLSSLSGSLRAVVGPGEGEGLYGGERFNMGRHWPSPETIKAIMKGWRK